MTASEQTPWTAHGAPPAASDPPRRKSRLRRVYSRTRRLSNLGLRVGLWLLIAFSLVAIARAYFDDAYTIGAFDVPAELAEAGYTREVVPRRIHDAMVELQTQSRSVRDFGDFASQASRAATVDVQVAGFGVSFESIARQLREATGRTHRAFGGELTRDGDSLVLALRQNGLRVGRYAAAAPERQVSEAALRQVFAQAAEGIYAITEPYLYANILDGRDSLSRDRALAIARELAYGDDEDERPWGLNLLGNRATADGDSLRAASLFRAAIAERPDFALAYSNLWNSLLARDSFAAAEKVARAAERALDREDYAARFASADYALALARGDDDAVHAAEDRIIREAPAGSGARWQVFNAQMSAGRLADAARSTDAALALEPENTNWGANRVLIAMMRERWDEMDGYRSQLVGRDITSAFHEVTAAFSAYGRDTSTANRKRLLEAVEHPDVRRNSTAMPGIAHLYVGYRERDTAKVTRVLQAFRQQMDVGEDLSVVQSDFLRGAMEMARAGERSQSTADRED